MISETVMKKLLLYFILLVTPFVYSCNKPAEDYAMMQYSRSDGKSVKVETVGDVQAYKGIRCGVDTQYFYQIEGHHNKAATLRFFGQNSSQLSFGGSEIETFVIPNNSDESDLVFVSGSVRLNHANDYLEGSFDGKVLRKWICENGIKHYTNDTIDVENGYFKVSLQCEYQQSK